MKYYNNYIVTKRFKKKSICGTLNLPFGTRCFTENHMICCDFGKICSVTSQNAFDYFTQNDDGCAELRRKLIDGIFDALNSQKQNAESYSEKWNRIWNDLNCRKYKRNEYEDHWLWNYDFYNAEIDDLKYIAGLVGAKVR